MPENPCKYCGFMLKYTSKKIRTREIRGFRVSENIYLVGNVALKKVRGEEKRRNLSWQLSQ